jgi:hypothetical protein
MENHRMLSLLILAQADKKQTDKQFEEWEKDS